MSISENNDRLTIIINKQIKEELKNIAKENNRSLSNYIAHILEQHALQVAVTKNAINKRNQLERELQRDTNRNLGNEEGLPRNDMNGYHIIKNEQSSREYNPYEVDFDNSDEIQLMDKGKLKKLKIPKSLREDE
ncbi:hypothetical protein BAOM_3124 [Peribacillus asahii]|uniref:Uncharacterized protein n=1 Tax=Peribacillus asahii TaxID=228899 RepID=A0A3Q9RP95_9BACI|nr:DUF6364 family protein [Peribacillus asahii]AZV43733.1 hypothetical protein BAOM_3124 [Peribacillus asahii]